MLGALELQVEDDGGARSWLRVKDRSVVLLLSSNPYSNDPTAHFHYVRTLSRGRFYI
jgi:hypothetical protein